MIRVTRWCLCQCRGCLLEAVSVVALTWHSLISSATFPLPTPRHRQSAKICFDANNPGIAPLHCHMLYHLAAGMLTTVEYAP